MRILLVLFVLTMTQLSFAQESLMTDDEQTIEMEKLAKSIRRSWYVSGHRHVSTSIEHNDLKMVETKLESLSDAEEPLSEIDTDRILACAQSEKCSVVNIDLTADYMGGSGNTLYWVLLDLNTRKTELIQQLLYAE